MSLHKILATVLTLSLGALWACDDGLDDNLTANKVYLVDSGLQEFEIYKTGELATYQVSVYRSGVDETSCTASVAVWSEGELDAYNEANETGYRMMPADCYSMPASQVSFDAARRDVSRALDIVFDPEKIDALPDGEYVLGLTLAEASVEINAEKSKTLLLPSVIEPLVYFTEGGCELDFGLGAADIAQEISVGFNAENRQDIACALAVAPELVDAYNSGHGMDCVLLPAEYYTLPESVVIPEGGNEASFEVPVSVSALPMGDYVLPIRLNSETFHAREGDDVYYLQMSVTLPILDTTGWTITANTEEPAETPPNGLPSSIIDGDIDTFWHSQWSGGWQDWPHIIDIDMQRLCEVISIDYYGRQDGSNPNTKDIEFLLSTDQLTWTSIGKFEATQDRGVQPFDTEDAVGRYLQVRITSSWDNTNNTNIGELIVHGEVVE